MKCRRAGESLTSRSLLALVTAVVLASCGTSDPPEPGLAASSEASTDTTATAAEETTTTTAPQTTATAEPREPAKEPDQSTTTTTTTTSAPEPQLVGERVFEPLPARDDPCGDLLPAGQYQFSMLLDDAGTITEVPLLVHVLPEVVEDNIVPTLVIDFHPSGFTLGRSVSYFVDRESQRLGGAVFVNPRADTTLAPSWGRTETFNRKLITQLWDEVSSALCFRPNQAVWGGVSEGTTLVVEAICETDLPMSFAVLGLGLHFRDGCDPSRPVPIQASSFFTPPAGGGPHWDGPYVPPNEWEAETATYDPAPDSLDRWAELYNCSDQRLETVVGDPEDVLERDSVVYSYTDCDALLTLIGFEIDDAGFAENPHVRSPSFEQVVLTRRSVYYEHLKARQ